MVIYSFSSSYKHYLLKLSMNITQFFDAAKHVIGLLKLIKWKDLLFVDLNIF